MQIVRVFMAFLTLPRRKAGSRGVRGAGWDGDGAFPLPLSDGAGAPEAGGTGVGVGRGRSSSPGLMLP